MDTSLLVFHFVMSQAHHISHERYHSSRHSTISTRSDDSRLSRNMRRSSPSTHSRDSGSFPRVSDFSDLRHPRIVSEYSHSYSQTDIPKMCPMLWLTLVSVSVQVTIVPTLFILLLVYKDPFVRVSISILRRKMWISWWRYLRKLYSQCSKYLMYTIYECHFSYKSF